MTWAPAFDPSRVPQPADRVYGFVGRELVVTGGVAAGDAALYVGDLDGVACFAAALERVPAGATAIGLRDALASLPADEAAVAGRAIQVLEWERDHRFCGRCGAETEQAPRDASRVCPSCGGSFYPRISPAAIMLVTRGDELLLACRPGGAFWSCLAGFVEPGETLEQAVVREVREEVGLDVGDVRYFGSQPWPFPGQLMVGFTAAWRAGEITVDEAELADARWFRRSGELPPVPPPFTIARSLIDSFVATR
jgi:NAD+ diphosphatase